MSYLRRLAGTFICGTFLSALAVIVVLGCALSPHAAQACGYNSVGPDGQLEYHEDPTGCGPEGPSKPVFTGT